MLTTRKVDARKVAWMAAERARKIGERAKERRLEMGLSQSAVAAKIGGASVTKDYISRWELGKVEVSEGYLDDLATALQTTIEDLMAGPVSERSDGQPATPDLIGQMNGERDQLDRIEALLIEIHAALVSRTPEAALDEAEALHAEQSEAVRRDRQSARESEAESGASGG